MLPHGAKVDLTIPLENDLVFYSAKIQVGTPAQEFLVLVDTGSSDLWIYDTADVCNGVTGPKSDCVQYGLFNTSASSTYHELIPNNFSIGYGDGTYAKGDWGEDTVYIEGVPIPKQQFGLAKNTTSTPAILGIGLTPLEAADKEYINIPKSLFLNGDIGSYTYSLYLDDLEATQGSLLFGGIDKSHFSGPLKTVPLISYYAFWCTLSSLDIKSEKSKSKKNTVNALNVPGAVLLDSGTTLTYLPEITLTTIMKTWNVDNDPDYGPVIPEYRLKELQDEYLEYNLQGAKIKVSASSLFMPAYTGDDLNTIAVYPNGQKAYNLLLTSSGNDTDGLILGDSFLRSAYVVYDLPNLQISIAQADYSGGPPQIEAIDPGLNAVPGATPVRAWADTYHKVPIPTTVSYTPTTFTLSPRPVWAS
ncbi:putative aspartic-type endopeptidase opsB [Yarrowia sp. C11]|nr:putative aspartic-type endopeptidase opsB [Yarrowia sp. C11]KAG5364688.1 putative aspartic-type endopeptidase opsB [Yarrowia sp. E02]